MAYMFIIAALLSIVFRYQIERSQACLYWGKKIASIDFLAVNPCGFQDAISPPSWSSQFLIVVISLVSLISYTFYGNGWGGGIIVVFVILIVSTVGGFFLIPKASSFHYLTKILNSLANRSANYSKAGDSERAFATKELFKLLFETAYGKSYQED